MLKQIHAITMVIALIGMVVAGVPLAHATNEIAPIPGSKRYNAGFSTGYLGLPLKGHHTQEYLTGYINGTSLYQFNRGQVFANNALPPESKNPDYLSGYQQGLTMRGNGTSFHTLPAHTDDNYKHFFVGYRDGAIQMDHDWNAKLQSLDHTCPSGHTEEYCAGYKAGYSDENALFS